MDLSELKTHVSEVAKHLRSNNFAPLADELDKYLREVEHGKIESVNEITKRCHIKWMGDIPIKELGFNEWIQLLGKVKKAAE